MNTELTEKEDPGVEEVLDEVIDLEEYAKRRQFELLPEDRQFLEECGLPWETIVDGSQWVLVHDFPTHESYNQPRVTAAVRMETGYPNTELNMVYFFPALIRKDGRPIRAAN